MTHVSHDHRVENQHTRFCPCDALPQFIKLNRYIDTSASNCKPLGPALFTPKPVCFNETNYRISYRRTSEEPKPGVSGGTQSMDKYLRIVAGRIEVETPEQLLGHRLDILMHESEQTKSDQEHQPTLSRL